MEEFTTAPTEIIPRQGFKGNKDVRLSVRHVGKTYCLYKRSTDLLKQQVLGRFGKKYGREFRALRDVSFEVRSGEMLGVIGRNGSGKTTLLQILAGTLQPTDGEVIREGRVTALLELGSGFNPEYTGRENVFMNGAILGISRCEMEDRFDEIASFADIGEFIDMPVKTYSSGMFVRLAFAVTISLDPDILLIDEALAVGDIFFRQKCYKRLKQLLEKGVAVVLVSHALNDVEQFCDRALVLQHGHMIFGGTASEAVKRYYLIEQEDRLAVMRSRQDQSGHHKPASRTTVQDTDAWPAPEAFLNISRVSQITNGSARCTGVAICSSDGHPSLVFQQGETASFFYEFEILEDIEVPIGGLVIQNDKGVLVHGKSTLEYGTDVPTFVRQGARLRFRQDVTLEIAVAEYTLYEIGLASISRLDYERRALYPYTELSSKRIRVCHLPDVCRFAVVFRTSAAPVQLLHHGVANLPGTCRVTMRHPKDN
jgi:lipopolysaccharide transport system ATP-binding protein